MVGVVIGLIAVLIIYQVFAAAEGIKRNTTSVRYLTGGCAGGAWTGAGTDGNGWIVLANNVSITNGPAADVIFSNLGAANPAGTFTVQGPSNAQTLTVTVAGSGRVTIP